MRTRSWIIFITLLCGCPGVKNPTQAQTKEIQIEGYSFQQELITDNNDPNWHILELRPTSLPYKGKFLHLSAQQRWLLMFHEALETINKKCGGSVRQEPEIRGEQHNYTAYANSPEEPKYIRARFACAQK